MKPDELAIYGSDEMIDRAWAEVGRRMEHVVTGNERADAAFLSMTEHSFKAGWVSCLKTLMEAENRKDGQT